MDKLVIQQSPPLSGEVIISGAKNADCHYSWRCYAIPYVCQCTSAKGHQYDVKLLEGMGQSDY